MGLLSNTVSICQFRVEGDLPKGDLFQWASDRLAARGFRSIDHTAEELSVGWVHLDDTKESIFDTPQTFLRDHYLAFTLRRDQRKVPAALFRAYFEQAQRDFLSANPGLQRVPKQKKEDLRDAVRGNLLAKTLPAPSFYDAVWDTKEKVLTLTSLSPKIIDIFETLFKQTFEGFRLVAIHPFARAERIVESELRELLSKANESQSDDVLDLIQKNRWIGWDFLFWLMYQTLDGSSEYAVTTPGPNNPGTPFIAYLNDRLQLTGSGTAGVQRVTVAGPQDSFREVCAALQGGKQIQEAILYFEKGENMWRLTLKGEAFHFASYKAPGVKIEKDDTTDPVREREAVFYERMFLLEEGLQLFDSLFAIFLKIRLDKGWSATYNHIESWFAEG